MQIATPFLSIMGAFAFLAGCVFAALTWGGVTPYAPFLCLTLFGAPGAALLLMSASVAVDESGIIVRKLRGEKRATWDEIQRVELGGGNLVLHLNPRGRLVLPGPEFWRGARKAEMIQFMSDHLERRGVAVKTTARAMFHVSNRDK